MTDPTAHGAIAGSVSANLERPGGALAVGAHPDDIDFCCRGTLAKWAAGGGAVHYLVLTDGSKGSWNPDQDGRDLVVQRQEEQQRASEIVGARGPVTFLGEIDGELAAPRG